jgi:hydroxymethylbilane synthase
MDASRPILIATRGSALALAQANTVLALCQAAFPALRFELRLIKTTGDKLQTASLASSELPKGLFTKEIEEALSRDEADLAVHSLKDLPTQLPEGLMLGAVLKRADVRDVLVRKAPAQAPDQPDQPERRFSTGLAPDKPTALPSLPPGATVASSSTRRRAQLLELRPDLHIVPIRGNVDTRLRKVAEQPELDATILAAAGLARLGYEIRPTGELIDHRPPSSRPAWSHDPIPLRAGFIAATDMLPCVGQAAIAIETKIGNDQLASILAMLDDQETHRCVEAERAFLAGMGGGCQLAVAAYAQPTAGKIHLQAVSFLGAKPLRGEITGPLSDPEHLGRQLAAQLATT